MIHFLISKVREAPGPARQARLILADLAEEILDLVEHYLGRVRCSPSGTGASPATRREDAHPSPAVSPEDASSAPVDSNSKADAEPRAVAFQPESALEVPGRLAIALRDASNLKDQEFKVLAILWDANARGMEAMSAKAVSQHGEKIGISIRHENVRKVIRTRIGHLVETRSEKVGNGTAYRYRIAKAGREHFESTYLAGG